MRKRLRLVLIIITVLFMLPGCAAVKSPKDLMKRPNSFEDEEVKRITSNFLTKGKTLSLTLGQKNREPIRKVDLDGDGSDEILLLYKEGEYRNEYGVMMLKKKNNQWHEINRIKGLSNGVELIEYSDITGDGKPEIFIGWNITVYDSEEKIEKTMNIYTYHNGYFESINIEDYINFGVDDLNGDGINELVLLSKLDNNVKILEVFKYFKGELLSIDKFTIDNSSNDNVMTIGNARKEQKGIFIDFYIGESSAYTDLFVLKDNKLSEVLGNENGRAYKTYQVYKVGSKDINGDGIIEIGILNNLNEVKEIPAYNTPWINLWYQWDGKNDLNLVEREYYNYDIGFKLKIPDNWGRMFTLKSSIMGENKVEFYSISESQSLDKLFLHIEKIDKDRWEEKRESIDEKTYTILEGNDENIIVAVIPKESIETRYIITEEKLLEIYETMKKE